MLRTLNILSLSIGQFVGEAPRGARGKEEKDGIRSRREKTVRLSHHENDVFQWTVLIPVERRDDSLMGSPVVFRSPSVLGTDRNIAQPLAVSRRHGRHCWLRYDREQCFTGWLQVGKSSKADALAGIAGPWPYLGTGENESPASMSNSSLVGVGEGRRKSFRCTVILMGGCVMMGGWTADSFYLTRCCNPYHHPGLI